MMKELKDKFPKEFPTPKFCYLDEEETKECLYWYDDPSISVDVEYVNGLFSLFSRDHRTSVEIYRDDLVEEELIKHLMYIFGAVGVLIRDTRGKYFIVDDNFTETIIELTGANYDSFFGNDHIEFFEAEHEIKEYLVGKEIKIYTTLTDKEIILSGEVVLGEVVYGSLIGIVQEYPEYKIEVC